MPLADPKLNICCNILQTYNSKYNTVTRTHHMDYLETQHIGAKWLLNTYSRDVLHKMPHVIAAWSERQSLVTFILEQGPTYTLHLDITSCLLTNVLTSRVDIYYIPAIYTYFTVPNDHIYYNTKLDNYLKRINTLCSYVFIPSDHPDEVVFTYDNSDGSIDYLNRIFKRLDITLGTQPHRISLVCVANIPPTTSTQDTRLHNMKQFVLLHSADVAGRIGNPTYERATNQIDGECVSYILLPTA
jgi:hypothetical protein